MLPPKLYIVVFYQVILVNRTSLTFSDLIGLPTVKKSLIPYRMGELSYVYFYPFSGTGDLLPPKLYLVVFYQVSLVNRTNIFCSDFRRPSEVLLGSACCTKCSYPLGGVVINVVA